MQMSYLYMKNMRKYKANKDVTMAACINVFTFFLIQVYVYFYIYIYIYISIYIVIFQ